jgi:FAM92 protein
VRYEVKVVSSFKFCFFLCRTLNKFDEVANVLKQYSETASNGENTCNVLMNFAKALALLGDFRQLQIQRIENCVSIV